MKRILLTLIVSLFVFAIVRADEEIEQNASVNDDKAVEGEVEQTKITAKTKRGIYGGYSVPLAAGYGYARHTPYFKYPGYVKHVHGAPITYAITPGSASVYSHSVNYPRFAPKPPVFVHSKPIVPSVYSYANRYPVFFNKPSVFHTHKVPFVPSTSFAAPLPFAPPAYPAHVHPVLAPAPIPVAPPPVPVYPQPTFVSSDGWRPIPAPLPAPLPAALPYPSAPLPAALPYPATGLPTAPLPAALPYPAASLPAAPLPGAPYPAAGKPSKPLSGSLLTQSAYLAQSDADLQHIDINGHELAHAADEQYHHQQHEQLELQEHLQHLHHRQLQQHAPHHHHDFYRSEQNEGHVTSLQEQGYEAASNNGRYVGPSSYDVHLNSRGRLL